MVAAAGTLKVNGSPLASDAVSVIAFGWGSSASTVTVWSLGTGGELIVNVEVTIFDARAGSDPLTAPLSVTRARIV